MSGSDVIEVVETALRLDLDDHAWLQQLHQVARPHFDRGLGMSTHTFQAASDGRFHVTDFVAEDLPEELAAAAREFIDGQPQNVFRQTHFESGPVVSLSEAAGIRYVAGADSRFRRMFERYGMGDVMGMRAIDIGRCGVAFSAPMKRPRNAAPSFRKRWSMIAAHIGTAQRLRRRLKERDAPIADDDAILRPDGALEHGPPDATEPSMRETLRDAVLEAQRARTTERHEPDVALELWRALVAGRWTLVDHFDSDGRRFVIARENPPDVRDPRALTKRESQVAAYAALGHDNQMIGYLLGLRPSTVSNHLNSALVKLRLEGRAELARLFEAQEFDEPPSSPATFG